MNLENLLKNTIKVAAVLLTSPATLAVAGNLYPDNPFQRVLVQAAALVLIEGALLLGWYQLDSNKTASTQQRVLYATLAVIAYVMLLVIAVSHGEGMAGIAFRITLAVLLGYSVFESGILAGLKLDKVVDRDPLNAPKVRRLARKLAQDDLMLDLRLQSTRNQTLSQRQHEALLVEGEKQLELSHLININGLEREYKDQAAPEKRKAMLAAQEIATQKARAKKSKRQNKLQSLVAEFPDATPRELAKKLDATVGTVKSDLKELEQISATSSNGHR